MKFNAVSRVEQGTSASRRLRHAGRVPAIVYGGKADPANIELDHNEIFHALRKEQFHASILTMDLDGKSEQVLLRAVQWHPYKQLVLHVDFQRVDASHAVNTKVPLHFINADISPAVKLNSAVISHVITELDIICMPSNLPQFIEIDLSQILGGETLHLDSVTMPKGVTYAAHGGDANPVLAAALVKSGGANTDDDDASPAAEQPEAPAAE